MFRIVFALTAIVSSAAAGCIAVDGAQITAGDLAKVSSEFTKLDAALVFSFAPVVGSQRIIPATELEEWATEHKLGKIHVSSACFDKANYELASDDILRALKAAIGVADDLRIDVLDVCQCKVPAGRLEFPISGASLPPIGHPESPVLWRGRLVAADGHPYPVWVRAQVTATIVAVRAAKKLRSGQILSREDLEEAKVSDSPLRVREAETLAAYEGQIINISVARGTVLQPELVHRPSDVERGSLVRVEVVNGGAHLLLAARAETTGNKGDVITLINPTGAARFHATVTGPERAQISLYRERLQGAAMAEAQPGNSVSGRSF
ncbi:MAG TPA: flagellar basal body P-ring formation chaperone FlgA [Bryobacteraceae bacterium]|jgi:flagella basal body P-ring formation protein FlgA|nr:flagellar basal body P-ring formation chaperone FlgA [Bryobacteraceae bacterium]